MTDRLKKLIQEDFMLPELTDDLIFEEVLDSLDMVEMVMLIEEEYGIEIPDEEAAGVLTFGDLKALIERLANE